METYKMPSYRRYRSDAHRMHLGCLGAILGALALIVVFTAGFTSYEYGSEHMVTFTVASKTILPTSNNGHKYLIFAANTGTTHDRQEFEDTDAIFHGKTNSTDLYFAIQPGMTLRCDTYGFRSHLFSGYRDLLWCINTKTGKDIVSGKRA